MALTRRALNRASLARQMLLGRESLGVGEAVHRVVAIQAQEPASPYIALWNRVADFAATDLDRAFAGHDVVKASLMRITLQAVDAADYPAFHEAMQPTLRASRLNDRRFKGTGLGAADADALIPDLLTFADRPRTNAEMDAFIGERLGAAAVPRAWWAIRTYGPFVHAPTVGPWSFGQRPAYLAAPEQRRDGDEDGSLARLVLRYLEGFGPASARDMAQFGLVHMPRVRRAIELLDERGSVRRLDGPDGAELWDVPDGLLPPEDAPAPPRLMAMWDSLLLAYSDRGRVIPPAYRAHVTRTNGDVLPTLLIDGHVAGVWRPAEGAIEATAFHPLPDDAWEGLETEARALLAFLADRDPVPYRRYGRWWQSMPAAQVRLLGR